MKGSRDNCPSDSSEKVTYLGDKIEPSRPGYGREEEGGGWGTKCLYDKNRIKPLVSDYLGNSKKWS